MKRFIEGTPSFRLKPLDAFLVALVSGLVLFVVAVPFSGAVAAAVVIIPTPPVPSTDISLSVTDSRDPVQVGELLTYDIDVSNIGPISATNVALTVDLPGDSKKPRVTNVTITTTQGSCGAPDSQLKLKCQLGSIAPGNTVVTTIVVEVTARAKGTLKTTSRIDASERDTNRKDNQVKSITTVQN